MIVEKIDKGKYIIDFVDTEIKMLKLIAIKYHNSNTSTCIDKILSVGFTYWADFEIEKAYKNQTDGHPNQEKKFGSAIESAD